MNYQALYRKYRPNCFDDFIDQDYIKKILVNSIKNNKISHAYLFSGPRGIGKTSMAKIFAKAINCLDFDKKGDVCNKCSNCIESNEYSVDIIEIDAASNNGVDQIRDLKNRISIVPNKLKYKVYIIDEVHMLTNSAFNALLKTLEEPPSYVVFILATTEFYEVPETIVSRCQCYNFSRISIKSMEDRLKYIAKQEKIKIDDETITEIAHFANGGLRDAIGMLDKLRSFSNDKINIDSFKQINGMISQDDIVNFYVKVFDGDINGILNIIDKIDSQGYDFKNFVEREMIYTRDRIIEYYTNNGQLLSNIYNTIEFVDSLNDVLNRLKDAINPLVVIQVFILKFIEKISRSESKTDDKIISREIIDKENEVLTEEKNNFAQNNIKLEKTCKNAQISGKKDVKITNKVKFSINQDIKKIRINNAMATANLNYKRELTDLWKDLDKFFMEDKYGKVAQMLFDTEPMVVGTNNLILTTISEGLIDNIYSNLDVAEEFIKSIYRNLEIVVLLNKDFEIVKNKYIEDKKNNIVYHVQEEYDKLINVENDLINQAIDIFGSDMVEIE